FKGETDVLDTWATSSVTPEIASNWVSKGEYDFRYEDKPFDLRPQAHDIIRTWLFYTIVKSYYHHQRIPWKNVVISGHAQDPHGRKMSKSLGNIVEPQEMIQKYSADSLRFWAAGSKLGDDLPFQDKDLLTGQKFVTKLWNASKFALMHLEDYDPTKISVTEVFDKWLLSKLHKVIKESTTSFENYEYAKTKAEVEQFFWHTFCDNYLEIVKDRLYNPQVRGAEQRKSAQYALYQSLLSILKMAAPIMPHITEEIYHLYFADREKKKSIHVSLWPLFAPKLVDEKAELAGDLGVDIINAVRKYKSEQQLSMKEGFTRLVLGNEDLEFREMIKSMEADLKAVLNVKEIVFVGETSLESDKFNVKIGLVK
ncbi:MAG TPA: class I tRNA ligase family protein, partial [Candidatus Nanoarchaeia archaeon]|nr:class I tRNA ligase family protein [Candidatus Nanoarchaeia archaeon]